VLSIFILKKILIAQLPKYNNKTIIVGKLRDHINYNNRYYCFLVSPYIVRLLSKHSKELVKAVKGYPILFINKNNSAI
jgi:hypothetical protein